jgi:UDP-N-acetylglucosamine 2-epimerase
MRDVIGGICTVIDPLPYRRMACCIANHDMELIVTDSGGLVEEAYLCQVKCVVARPTTERWEALMSGLAILAPTNEHIEPAIGAALSHVPHPTQRCAYLFGGRPSDLVTQSIMEYLQ